MGHRPTLRVTPQYAVRLFCTIVLIATMLSFALLSFSADRIEAYELQKVKTSLQLAADDLENQFDILADIAYRIQITSYYKPATIRLDAYREIVLLKDFVYFRNFSPLLERYFLLYPDLFPEQQKIFTSDGETAYFRFYAPSVLDVSADEADGIYQSISETYEREYFILDNYILLLCPIRFIETQMQDSRAVVAFILPKNEIVSRMEHMAIDLPSQISVFIDKNEILSRSGNESNATSHSQTHHFEILSSQNSVMLTANIAKNKWETLLNSTLSSRIFVGFVLALISVAAISIVFARSISKPIQRLIDRYMPARERLKNEFAQLEDLVSKMVRENGNSIRQLCEHILQNILRGYYNESLLQHWGFLQFDFSKHYYCTYIVDTAKENEDEIVKWKESIEQCSDEEICYYAVRMPEDRVLAIIAGFNAPENQVQHKLETSIPSQIRICAIGKMCNSPQRLSASYLDAINTHLQDRERQTECIPDVHKFLLHLVTAAERGIREDMRQICRETLLNTSGIAYSRTLVRNTASQIMAELNLLAIKRGISLDQARLSALLQIPNIEMLVQDTYDFVQDAFFRETDETQSRIEVTAQAIVNYVCSNASNPDIDLCHIAEHFGLSNDYVSLMIKKATGAPFKEYLTDVRLEQAKELLVAHPEMTINEISQAIGYRKTSNFIKKFKDIYGVTPAKYR